MLTAIITAIGVAALRSAMWDAGKAMATRSSLAKAERWACTQDIKARGTHQDGRTLDMGDIATRTRRGETYIRDIRAAALAILSVNGDPTARVNANHLMADLKGGRGHVLRADRRRAEAQCQRIIDILERIDALTAQTQRQDTRPEGATETAGPTAPRMVPRPGRHSIRRATAYAGWPSHYTAGRNERQF